MADDIDRAQDREMLDRVLAIQAAAVPALTAVGVCHNCDASVPPGAKFCDIDCRDDWQKRNPRR